MPVSLTVKAIDAVARVQRIVVRMPAVVGHLHAQADAARGA